MKRVKIFFPDERNNNWICFSCYAAWKIHGTTFICFIKLDSPRSRSLTVTRFKSRCSCSWPHRTWISRAVTGEKRVKKREWKNDGSRFVYFFLFFHRYPFLSFIYFSINRQSENWISSRTILPPSVFFSFITIGQSFFTARY